MPPSILYFKSSSGTIIKGNDLFSEFKGALTEQFVCKQLIQMKIFIFAIIRMIEEVQK